MPAADPLHRLLQPLAGVRWGLLALRRQAEAGQSVAAELGQLEALVTQALQALSREFKAPMGIETDTASPAEGQTRPPEPAPAPPTCTI